MSDTTKLAPAPPPDDDQGAFQRFLTKLFGKNYRTTIAGFAVGALGVARLGYGIATHTLTPDGIFEGLGLIVGGGGLNVAKDHNVSGTGR